MPFSSDHDSPLPAGRRGTDPFASLTASRPRRRFWLFELLVAPFQDHDERATYRSERRRTTQTEDAKGVRVSKAWNGNGVPVIRSYEGTVPTANGSGTNGHAGINGYAVTGGGVPRNGNGGGLFSSADRRPAGH